MSLNNLNLYLKNAEWDLRYAKSYAEKYDLRNDAMEKLKKAYELVEEVREHLRVK